MERIVVGIDGSEGSEAALRWAVAEARLRGAMISAVTAWSAMLSSPGPDLLPVDLMPYEEAANATLREVLDKVPSEGVTIEVAVAVGAPADALLKASHGASLVVVGSRGRGGFAGLLLGSVSQQIAHHARCPVVIIPHDMSSAG